MVNQFTNRLTDYFCEKDIIKKHDRATFRYCFEVVFILTIFLLFTLPVAFLLHLDGPALLFLFIFILLRSLAGGFHAKSPEYCLILSVLSFYTFLLISQIYVNNIYTVLSFLLLIILISFKAPIEAKNYSLSASKKKRHKMQCCLLLLLLAFMYYFLLAHNLTLLASSIYTAILFTGVALLITK